MPMNDDVRREIADGRSVFMPLIAILKGEPAEQTMDEARAAYIRVKARQLPPDGMRFEAVDMGGVPGLSVTPPAASVGVNVITAWGGVVKAAAL